MNKLTKKEENKIKKFVKNISKPIYHFFSKLLWLKDNMQTKLGKKIAEERHKFMVNFLKKYKDEYK